MPFYCAYNRSAVYSERWVIPLQFHALEVSDMNLVQVCYLDCVPRCSFICQFIFPSHIKARSFPSKSVHNTNYNQNPSLIKLASLVHPRATYIFRHWCLLAEISFLVYYLTTPFQKKDCIAPIGTVVDYWFVGKDLDGSGRSLIGVPPRHFPGVTEESQEDSQSR
jgi:hypothetical protein